MKSRTVITFLGALLTVSNIFCSCSTPQDIRSTLPAGIYEVSEAKPSKNNHDYFKYLDSLVDEAEIIGLGEPVHTSEGFYEAKFAFVQYLVEKKNLRQIAFEDSYIAAEDVNDFIQGKEISVTKASSNLYRVWHSKSIMEMFEWLRSYNLNHPTDRVHFFGFDIASLKETKARANLASVPIDALIKNQIEQCISSINDAGSLDQTSCARCLDKAESKANQARETLQLLTSYKYLIQRACVMEDIARRNSVRDEGMAKLFLNTSLKVKSSTKTLLWSANRHITKIGYDRKVKPLGAYLFETFGDRYIAIGLVAGKFDTFEKWPLFKSQSKAQPGSPEEWLSTYNKQYIFANHRQLEPQAFGIDPINRSDLYSYLDAIYYMNYSRAMTLYE